MRRHATSLEINQENIEEPHAVFSAIDPSLQRASSASAPNTHSIRTRRLLKEYCHLDKASDDAKVGILLTYIDRMFPVVSELSDREINEKFAENELLLLVRIMQKSNIVINSHNHERLIREPDLFQYIRNKVNSEIVIKYLQELLEFDEEFFVFDLQKIANQENQSESINLIKAFKKYFNGNVEVMECLDDLMDTLISNNLTINHAMIDLLMGVKSQKTFLALVPFFIYMAKKSGVQHFQSRDLSTKIQFYFTRLAILSDDQRQRTPMQELLERCFELNIVLNDLFFDTLTFNGQLKQGNVAAFWLKIINYVEQNFSHLIPDHFEMIVALTETFLLKELRSGIFANKWDDITRPMCDIVLRTILRTLSAPYFPKIQLVIFENKVKQAALKQRHEASFINYFSNSAYSAKPQDWYMSLLKFYLHIYQISVKDLDQMTKKNDIACTIFWLDIITLMTTLINHENECLFDESIFGMVRDSLFETDEYIKAQETIDYNETANTIKSTLCDASMNFASSRIQENGFVTPYIEQIEKKWIGAGPGALSFFEGSALQPSSDIKSSPPIMSYPSVNAS